MSHGIRFALFLSALALVESPAGAAPVIANGGFDDEVPRNVGGGGWNSEHIDGIGGWYSWQGAPAPSFRLNEAGSPSSDPRIWQTVDGFEIGQAYTLYGDYALGVAYGAPANSFEVRVDGVTVLSLGPTTAQQQGGTVFEPFQVTFIATATSHVIEIAAECSGIDHDYFVDNLSFVEPTATARSSWGAVKSLF